MNQDLKYIKKKYGENMSKLCRNLFSSLLEKEGLLPSILINNFEESHLLYKDIVKSDMVDEFKDYIYGIAYEIDNQKQKEIITTQTPKELLSQAGYELFECNSEEEIQKFKKYYKKEETLCTFWGGRLDHCHVFFAVKKDVENIKREDFPKPRRQDTYGTSVISIQFTKDESHTLSIKNRYNHIVDNPDATFSNNLDNIIAGLTESFENEYGLIQRNKRLDLEIPGYVRANDGKFYKYNMEISNVYYCPNNVIIDNFEVKKFSKEKYIILDYFILDLVNKKIFKPKYLSDSFVDTIYNIEKIDINKEENNKRIIIYQTNKKEISIVINENSEIIGYSNPNLQEVENDFLRKNKSLEKLELPNLQEVGYGFLSENKSLEKLYSPNLKKAGNNFLRENKSLEELYSPNLQKVGDNFLRGNKLLKELYSPNLQEVGDKFLRWNESLKKLELSNLQKVGDYFLSENKILEKIYSPNLQEVGNEFLRWNESLKKLELSNLQKVGNYFLRENEILEKIELPNLQKVGRGFLWENRALKKLELSNLQKAGDDFLKENESLEKLVLPKYSNFLCDNPEILNVLKRNCSLYSDKNIEGMEIDGGKHL